jgi:hypothetical protein
MTDATVLLRQVHPSFVQQGRITSQVFRPTPKDEGKLSAYDGDQIEPEASWTHYTAVLSLSSDGVLGVTVQEFGNETLPVRLDPSIFPEHVIVDYTAFGATEIEKKSKRLKSIAEKRGWLFQPQSD